MNRIAILGASRGLGLELARQLHGPETQLLLFSRKIQAVEDLINSKKFVADFTKPEDQFAVIEELKIFDPQQIYYVAGGGPYGAFEKKEWKDHLWAFELNFLFPAKLMFQILPRWDRSSLQEAVFIGSAIADAQPDANAASYCAAKHALRGLITSLQKENPDKQIHFYSPGYIDTPMLPPKAQARNQSIANVAQVAREIILLK